MVHSEILEKIHNDPLLVRKKKDGLIIAKNSKGLPWPKELHQKYAKGIVYREEDMTLISLPLTKFYNHFESEAFKPSGDYEVIMSKKYDGTMIQAFLHEGELWVTTRGMFDSEYTKSARAFIESQKIEIREGLTYIFELVMNQHVSRYDFEGLVLLSVRRHSDWKELADLEQFQCKTTETVSETAVEWALAEADENDHEGWVVNYAKDGLIINRIKIKGDLYIKKFRALNLMNPKGVAGMAKELQSQNWEEFKEKFTLMPEELLPDYMKLFNYFNSNRTMAMRWAVKIKDDLKAFKGSRKEYVAQYRECPHFHARMWAFDDREDLDKRVFKGMMGLEFQDFFYRKS